MHINSLLDKSFLIHIRLIIDFLYVYIYMCNIVEYPHASLMTFPYDEL